MRATTKHAVAAILACALFLTSSAALAQSVFPKDSLVRQRCSACHKPDEKDRLEVIEETRKTPEEWKVVVDRMIRINGAPLEDAGFDAVIKELSRYLCLTPEEMGGVAYINSDENSQYRELPSNELELKIMGACARCHTFGKVKSHRMTLAQWGEARNLHLGYYPTAIMQMREMDWAKVFEELLEPLSQLYPYDDPKWHEWMKNRKEQDLTGTWNVAGYQPGLGYYEGAYVFKPNPDKGDDEYLVEREVRYENGIVLKTSGFGTLYSEYHLRYALAPNPLMGRVEGVFDLDADAMGFAGKWWTVIQDSNSYGNERFFKTGETPKVFAVYPKALKAADGTGRRLTLVGVGLPADAKAADFEFSDANVKVTKIESAGASKIVCQVQAGAAARGAQTLTVKGIRCDEPVIVYAQTDAIRIFPPLGRARVSCGAAYPPQGVQFVARGVDYGPDGKPDTEDDIFLEPVNAKWWLEEESTREDDDDLKYLKAPIANGLYTPVTTYGPIAERHQEREGVGLIAVGASFKDGDRELQSRALLAVTVPDFIPQIK